MIPLAEGMAANCEYQDVMADLFHALSQPLTTLQCCLTGSLHRPQSAGRYRRDLQMPYIGGLPVYVQKCNEVMNGGFEGFVLDGARDSNATPAVRYTERWREPLDIDVISPAAVAARRVPMV